MIWGNMGVRNEMNEWYDIRKKVLNEGVSKRQVMREQGLGWATLKKILKHSKPDKYRMSEILRSPGQLDRSFHAHLTVESMNT